MDAGTVGEDKNRLVKEQRLRKTVYNAIVALSECADETTLQKMLNSLDQSSWMEVIEERYLGTCCGFPLCNNPVQVKNSQKYRIDLKNKKVYERSAEIDKFCCQNCFLRSSVIRSQLETEPLWIRGDQRVKVFDLDPGDIMKKQQNICHFELIEDKELITSLEKLEIGDAADPDYEDHNNETETDEEKRVHDREEFYNLSQSYLAIRPAVFNSEKRAVMPTIKFKDETVTEMNIKMAKKYEQFSENEKLVRIRNKYQQNKLKWLPEIIEAKPLSSQLSNKVPENFYEIYRRVLSEWCGPETIYYLQYRRRGNLRDDENEIVDDVRSVIAQFYAGDRPINKKIEGIMSLPLIDNVDQAKRRIFVLNELLKQSWRNLEEMLSINGCGQQALKIISTFRLSARNIVIERKMCDLAVAVIFRLLAYCDASLMGFYPSDGTVSSKLMKYLEQKGFDAKCYFEILSTVMNKLE